MSKRILTEKELMQAQCMQTYFIDTRNSNWGDTVEELDELLPCVYHLNNKIDMSIEFMSQKGEDRLALSKEEIVEMGANFLTEYVHPDTLKIIPKLVEFYQKGEDGEVFSFFQKIRLEQKEEYQWVFTSTKVYRKRDALITIVSPVKELDEIGHKMNRILDENALLKANFHRFMSLTPREKELIKLLATGLTSQQIGEQLFISTQTVDKHRKNIYYKLGINNIVELVKLAQAFDLV